MKIIQIIPMFGLAGAETMCENLTLELARQGHQVQVISLYDYHSDITVRMENSGVFIHYLGKKAGLDVSIIKKIVNIFRDFRPDVVHSHLYALKYSTAAAILTGVKVKIHTMHNIATKEASKQNQIINRIIFRCTNTIPVSLSSEIQKTVMQRYKLSVRRTPIVFNGIDLNKCMPKQSYECKSGIHFIHIGRFSAQKNHKLLIDSFYEARKTLKESTLSLLGTGELMDAVKDQVESLGLSNCIFFVGLQSDVYPYLNKADAFVLSSNYEGMPMSLIEAMGTGLPIVSTDVGGIPSMIKDNETGLLAKTVKHDLANAMIKLRDESLRQRLGRKAREHAEKNFSVISMTSEYLSLYKNQLSENKNKN